MYIYSASEASQYLFMKIEIHGICMRQKSVYQYVRRVQKNERNAHAQYKISLLSNFISSQVSLWNLQVERWLKQKNQRNNAPKNEEQKVSKVC